LNLPVDARSATKREHLRKQCLANHWTIAELWMYLSYSIPGTALPFTSSSHLSARLARLWGSLGPCQTCDSSPEGDPKVRCCEVSRRFDDERRRRPSCTLHLVSSTLIGASNSSSTRFELGLMIRRGDYVDHRVKFGESGEAKCDRAPQAAQVTKSVSLAYFGRGDDLCDLAST